MEKLQLVETAAKTLRDMGRFVVGRLQGGAGAELPHGEQPPAHPPQRAHHIPENIVRGSE